jgi:IclR family acetate operon transcriptional repressor
MPRPRALAALTVQSVDKAVRVLWALGENDDGAGEMGVLELSRRTGLTASTVSRLLNSLVAGRLVAHNPATGRYRVGLGVVTLANAALGRLDLRELAHPHLLALEERLYETASLSVYAEGAVTVDVVPSRHTVLSMARLGRPALPHCTATGKVLLAHQPEATVARVLAAPLVRCTPRTLTAPDQVRAELERVRAQGYATAEGEREPDLNAVAVPIDGQRAGVLGALCVQGPASRFDRAAMEAAVPLLQAEARAITQLVASG